MPRQKLVYFRKNKTPAKLTVEKCTEKLAQNNENFIENLTGTAFRLIR